MKQSNVKALIIETISTLFHLAIKFK